MLRVEGLDVSIGPVGILRNVALAIDEAQFVGLIGRNGAGKTTLMRSVMGLLRCRHGTITFDGRDLTSRPAHERAPLGIGYIPEDRRLIPSLTVQENLMLPAWATRAPDPASRLEKVYRIVPETIAFRDRRGQQLSGGQQKLAALARALMCGTRLLLLDEPFEGVAPVLRQRLVEVIAQLRGEGVSILLSESSLAHAGPLLDRVYRIDRGEVSEDA